MARATERITWLDVSADSDAPAEVTELWEKPLEKLGARLQWPNIIMLITDGRMVIT